MPGGLEKRRLEGVCACAAPLEAAPAAAMVIAAAITFRREAGVAESNSEIMACSLVSRRMRHYQDERTMAAEQGEV
jgi:hypothetical protein